MKFPEFAISIRPVSVPLLGVVTQGRKRGVPGVSSKECAEIVQKTRHYLRVVRNVADNQGLDGDLARLERELRNKRRHHRDFQVLNLAHFRRGPGTKKCSSDLVVKTCTEMPGKDSLQSLLVDIGLFACFVCLVCSVCSLISLY